MMASDVEHLEPFTYNALKKDTNLRIIQLRHSIEKDAALFCNLDESEHPAQDTHGFDESQKLYWGYEALSWCWSNNREIQDENLTIQVGPNARSLSIRGDLAAALKALRHPAQDRYLWVDSISIDQKNTKEKNFQVARMSYIYREASNVCVWLGAANEHSKRALAFIKDHLSNVYMFDDLLVAKHVDNWVALKELLKRPWFHRRWIVQEIALASSATIYCGNDSIPWKEFTSAISLLDKETIENLQKPVQSHTDHGHHDRYFNEVHSLSAVILIRVTEGLLRTNAAGSKTLTSSLEAVVAELATFETAEPRDLIYALLNLAKDSQRAIGPSADFVMGKRMEGRQKKFFETFRSIFNQFFEDAYPVRYEDDIEKVYQHFIAYAISHADGHRALDVICRPFAKSYTMVDNDRYKTGEDKRDSTSRDSVQNGSLTSPRLNRTNISVDRQALVELPSWIPNLDNTPMERKHDTGASFRRFGRVTSYTMRRRRGDLFISNPDIASYYNASTKAYDKKKVYFRKRADHFSMFVEGFVLDEIEKTYETSNAGEIPEPWLKLRQSFKDLPGDGKSEEYLDKFSRTVTADRNINRNVQPAFYQSTLKTIFDMHETGRSISVLKPEQLAKDASKPVREVLEHVENTLFARRLVQTKTYNLLGLAPAETCVGDLVCILFGCSVPVILRRCGKKNTDQEKQQDDADRKHRRETALRLWKSVKAKREENRADITVEKVRNHPIVMSVMKKAGWIKTESSSSAAERRHTSPMDELDEPTTEQSRRHTSAADEAGSSSAEQLRRHTLPSAQLNDTDDRKQHKGAPSTSESESSTSTLPEKSKPAELVQMQMQDNAAYDNMLERSRWPRLAVLLATILVLLFVVENLLLATVLSLLTSLHVLTRMLRPLDNSSNALIALVSIITVPSISIRLRWTLLQAALILFALFLGLPSLIPAIPQEKSDTNGDAAPKASEAHEAVPTTLDADHQTSSSTVTGDGEAKPSSSTSNGGSITQTKNNTKQSSKDGLTTQAKNKNKQSNEISTDKRDNHDHDAHKYWYKLIGESYIDSMMNGEALELQSASVDAKKSDRSRMWNVIFELR